MRFNARRCLLLRCLLLPAMRSYAAWRAVFSADNTASRGTPQEHSMSIRPATRRDTEAILDIWLEASIAAHSFIDAAFWRDNIEAMRTVYLPSATTVCVYDTPQGITGFYALHKRHLAALFVAPRRQRNGTGRCLFAHALRQAGGLTLNVYAENRQACDFYLAQGCTIAARNTDPHTGRAEYIMTCAPAEG